MEETMRWLRRKAISEVSLMDTLDNLEARLAFLETKVENMNNQER